MSRGNSNSAPRSRLPWSRLVPNWGAMARPQQPLCSVAHQRKLDRRHRGILGFCKCLPGHRTGMQTKSSLEITRRRSPFWYISLSHAGGCWLLLVKGLVGHGDISAPDILSLVSLIFPGQELLSQRKGERFFIMGVIPFDYGFKKFITNHLFLSTFQGIKSRTQLYRLKSSKTRLEHTGIWKAQMKEAPKALI